METSYPSRRMGGVAVLGGIWEIVFCRPWRSADGEIDIVAVERQVLVVCEMTSRMPVRYRSLLASSTGQARTAVQAGGPASERPLHPFRPGPDRCGRLGLRGLQRLRLAVPKAVAGPPDTGAAPPGAR
jgi:hypothetical protein